jgi:large subunit ribosomal protein L25
MANHELEVLPREVLGKKVKALRREGLTPANIYGHGLESQAVQADTPTLVNLLRSVGRNAVLTLHVRGEKAPRPVMVRAVQRNPVTDNVLHVDFYQVSLTEKMRADVPLVLVGSAPAVADQGGVLLQSLDSVSVEALPGNIPAHIEVDVSRLEQIDDAVHVRDLTLGPEVALHTEPELVIAKVAAPRIAAELEAEAAAAAAEEEAAAVAAAAKERVEAEEAAAEAPEEAAEEKEGEGGGS